MNGIQIRGQGWSLSAELNDSRSSRAIWDALPITGRANIWGEEIYFEIPVALELEADAREEVEVGDLGYWPTGNAFCIFFGRTPVSAGDRPRAYSPVNVLGSLSGDVAVLKNVADGEEITLDREP
jgi:hypothetical protein